MNLLFHKEKVKKLWMTAPLCLFLSIWKERNLIVFEDLPFSYTRLKNSFISSSFSIWAGLLYLGEDSFVRNLEFFFAFSKIVFLGGRFFV